MAKISHLVAILLIAAVLGGTQCVELCAFRAADRESKSTQADEAGRPCHQQHEQEDSKLPAGDGQCAHHELIAEKRSKASSTDDLQAVSFVAVRIEAHVAPVVFASSLPVFDELFPRFSPLNLTSILRI